MSCEVGTGALGSESAFSLRLGAVRTLRGLNLGLKKPSSSSSSRVSQSTWFRSKLSELHNAALSMPYAFRILRPCIISCSLSILCCGLNVGLQESRAASKHANPDRGCNEQCINSCHEGLKPTCSLHHVSIQNRRFDLCCST